ncbi:MAG TPA: hypothetical protein VLM89_06450 [Phycisphaerae bacterium]|nr:hypothetical protein [Phycisphaerae bacterium]
MVSRWVVLLLMLIAAGPRPPLTAQQPSAGRWDKAIDRPTEYGLRFTPEMARALARTYANEVLVSRYELDQSKTEQAAETVARRVMDMAHRLDERGFSQAMELMVENVMARQQEAGNAPMLQSKSAQAIGESLKPAMPAFKDLVKGIAQDVRPMLAPKQQLKFGADVLAFSTALNAIEENLDRWARGEARPFEEDPFQPSTEPRLDESGRSSAYNAAERGARETVEKGALEEWKKYVKDAKQFYGLDDGQAAAADSILNEATQQAATYTQDETWRNRAIRNRLWQNMLLRLGVGRVHPLRYELDRQYDEMLDPINAVGQNLRQRVDGIPTQAQRQMADARLLEALGAQGFVEESPETPSEETEQKVVEPESRDQTVTGHELVVEPVFDERGLANEEPLGADVEP